MRGHRTDIRCSEDESYAKKRQLPDLVTGEDAEFQS